MKINIELKLKHLYFIMVVICVSVISISVGYSLAPEPEQIITKTIISTTTETLFTSITVVDGTVVDTGFVVEPAAIIVVAIGIFMIVLVGKMN